MGLRVDIISGSGINCSNGGVSSTKTQLTLVNVDGPFEPTEEAPSAMLESNGGNTVKVVPVWGKTEVALETGKYALGPMMGGCYVATSDTRFGEALRKLGQTNSYIAVPLHDRYETQQQYDILSR